jgi:hypothetical protein
LDAIKNLLGNYEIYILDPDTGNVRALTNLTEAEMRQFLIDRIVPDGHIIEYEVNTSSFTGHTMWGIISRGKLIGWVYLNDYPSD